MNMGKLVTDKKRCVFKDKPSCIDELKELADSLVDRDTLMKNDYTMVKSIIHDAKLSNAQKIKKIKTLIDVSK